MKIYACPKCGSKDIQMGGIREGELFGITSWTQVCRKCGCKGQPIIFDSEKEYKKFLEELKKDTEPKKKATTKTEICEDPGLSKKEKEVLEFLNELEEEESQREGRIKEEETHKDKNWWLEIGLAIGISAILIILTVPDQILLFGVIIGVLYSLIFFIVLALFILLWIVIIEYFYNSVKNVLKRR